MTDGLSGVIDFLNLKLNDTQLFNSVLCLCEKITREDKSYPSGYNGLSEYKEINLDAYGSVCYWRKNGDVSIQKQESSTSVSSDYKNTIPLKLIGFKKKEAVSDGQYFADNICLYLISKLTVENSGLKPLLGAKTATIYATKYVTNPKAVGLDEYDNINFEPRYTHAYFSIDFELVFITNNQCYINICPNG